MTDPKKDAEKPKGKDTHQSDKPKEHDTEGPMGDTALTEESAKDPDVDRSKTPGRSYDV